MRSSLDSGGLTLLSKSGLVYNYSFLHNALNILTENYKKSYDDDDIINSDNINHRDIITHKNYYSSYVSFKTNIANVRKLILKVTDKCNFSCTYCIYNNCRYYNNSNNIDMSKEIATKAIDYFFALINSTKRTSSI